MMGMRIVAANQIEWSDNRLTELKLTGCRLELQKYYIFDISVNSPFFNPFFNVFFLFLEKKVYLFHHFFNLYRFYVFFSKFVFSPFFNDFRNVNR